LHQWYEKLLCHTFADSDLMHADFIDQKLIDLNAEYQRGEYNLAVYFVMAIVISFYIGVVWNDTKQMGLIDSLFRNFHVPSIIFGQEHVSLLRQLFINSDCSVHST